ncbi:MAG TPA: hypothetical protein VH934_18910 [Xanthobacteraceae bacterium]|jgi:hypothetical protein
MQSGSGGSAGAAERARSGRVCGGIAVLLLGFALSACANGGQIGEPSAGGHAAVAIESVDGASAPVVHKFVDVLKDEAAAHHIAVVAPAEATYRLRGYLAASGHQPRTSVTWAIDVYGADQHRAVRLTGQEEATAHAWRQADNEVLRRIAHASVERLVVFLSSARPPSAPAFTASAQTQRTASASAGLDD